MSEERALPPLLRPGLRLVFIGYNPGIESARQGHYYAFRGNVFWKQLNASGLVTCAVGPDDDATLMDLAGIGFTDLCGRSTVRAEHLGREERAAGARRLRAELEANLPRVAVFGGKGIYAEFSGRRTIEWGLQPEAEPWAAWVIPSSSGLASRWHALRLELLREIAASLR